MQPLALLALACLALTASTAGASGDHAHPLPGHVPGVVELAGAAAPAETPAGVTPLALTDLYVLPVGPRGLVYRDAARALDGKRVRIVGHVVRRTAAPPGTLMLAPHPVLCHEHEYGQAEDLPASIIDIDVPHARGQDLPVVVGPVMVTGILGLGPRQEPDGRVSHARLTLDPPDEATASASTIPSQR